MSHRPPAKAVCLIVQSFYDIDSRVRRKAESLVAAGYAVDVLALCPPGRPVFYELEGVNVHTFSLGKHRGSLARYVYEYAAFFLWVFVRTPIMMRRRRYCAIDVNTLPDFLIFAPVLGRWLGAMLILDMHEITPEFYISKYGIAEDSWMVRLLQFQERVSFNFADYVITITEPILDLLESRGLSRSKSTVLTNAADESKFADAVSAQARGIDGVSDRFVMTYHGTLTKIYGLDIAVEAFALAHQRMPGAELWILGDGPEADSLKCLAEQRGLSGKVRMPGQVPSSEIPGWLGQSTVGILPIRRDVFLDFAFPNKLPELIVMGKAVIVSRLKTIRHYFSEEALAFFEPNNPEDLAEQMVRVYEDRPLRERLRRRATVEYAAIRWDIMRERYLTLVGKTLDRPPAR